VDTGTSYSLYAEAMERWFSTEVDARWGHTRTEVLALLQRDGELREVAGVVGPESLEDGDRLLLAASSMVREMVLGQSAFDPNDAYSPPAKTHGLARAALDVLACGREALAAGATFAELELGPVRRAMAALRDAPASEASARADELAVRIEALRAAGAAKKGAPP
jgi:V/A-type H+-transporting ATPase subunit A